MVRHQPPLPSLSSPARTRRLISTTHASRRAEPVIRRRRFASGASLFHASVRGDKPPAPRRALKALPAASRCAASFTDRPPPRVPRMFCTCTLRPARRKRRLAAALRCCRCSSSAAIWMRWKRGASRPVCVCIYACVCVCVCVSMYVYSHTHTHAYIHVYTHTSTPTYTHTSTSFSDASAAQRLTTVLAIVAGNISDTAVAELFA